MNEIKASLTRSTFFMISCLNNGWRDTRSTKDGVFTCWLNESSIIDHGIPGTPIQCWGRKGVIPRARPVWKCWFCLLALFGFPCPEGPGTGTSLVLLNNFEGLNLFLCSWGLFFNGSPRREARNNKKVLKILLFLGSCPELSKKQTSFLKIICTFQAWCFF